MNLGAAPTFRRQRVLCVPRAGTQDALQFLNTVSRVTQGHRKLGLPPQVATGVLSAELFLERLRRCLGLGPVSPSTCLTWVSLAAAAAEDFPCPVCILSAASFLLAVCAQLSPAPHKGTDCPSHCGGRPA